MKILFLSLIVFLSTFITSESFASRYACAKLFDQTIASRNDPATIRPYDFKSMLVKGGFNVDLIRFEVHPQAFGDQFKGILIVVKYAPMVIGYLTIIRAPNDDRYESHIHLEPIARHKGMGLLLYVLGAKVVHEYYGGILTSSKKPSAAAINVWEWVVRNGWGTRVSMANSFKFRKRYQFKDNIVDKNFDDVYMFFLKRKDHEMPDIEWLSS